MTPGQRVFLAAIARQDQTAEITRLQAENAGLKAALEPFANAHNRRPFINDQHPDYDKELADEQAGITWGDFRRALATLKGEAV
jgi:hypothetical protein